MSRSSSSSSGPVTITGTYTMTVTNTFSVSQNISVTANQSGNLVIVDIAGINVTAASAVASANSTAAVIPVGLRPASSVYHLVPIISLGSLLSTLGKIEILSTGFIKVWVSPNETTTFGITSTCGWQRTCLTYTI